MLEDQLRWDERYRTMNHCDRGQASPPLQEILERLTRLRAPGQTGPAPLALDLACGLGRNARALAKAGYQVTAIDISREALVRAEALAGAEQHVIHWQQADLDHVALGQAQYDFITCTLFLDRRLLETIPDALKPGGVVWYEALVLEERDGQLLGNRAHRVEPNELLKRFMDRGIRILRWEEGLPGQAQVATLLGMRPV